MDDRGGLFSGRLGPLAEARGVTVVVEQLQPSECYRGAINIEGTGTDEQLATAFATISRQAAGV